MSIEDILRALDDQCREECQEIFSKAEQESKQILEKSKQEAEAIRQARLAKIKAEAQSETTSMLYSARLKSKNAVISAKEIVAEKAMADAEKELKNLRSRKDYPAVLEGLIGEGLTRVSGKVVCHVDPADKELADSILRKQGVDYEVIADLKCIGGCIISDPEGRVNIINTVEERLNRAREKLRMDVSGILFEEEAKTAVVGG
jgi:V/A-type H+/Na+-transporting ATPase subunit E